MFNTLTNLFFKNILTRFKNRIFIFLFLLNLVFSSVCLYNGINIKDILIIVTSSAFIAFIEYIIYYYIPWNILRKIYLYTLITLYIIVGIVDFFLLYKFKLIISEGIWDTLLVTNPDEIHNFFQSYLPPITIILFTIFFIISISILIYCSKLFKNSLFAYFSITSTIIGFVFFVIYALGLFYPQYSLHISLPKYNCLSRATLAYYLAKNSENIGELRHICINEHAYKVNNDSTIIVVVIGESHSIYHSSLYGYAKETNPLLMKRFRNNELLVYSDVVSTADVTYAAMRSFFSLDSLGLSFNKIPLFPASFKAAGYRTILFDNNYLVGQDDFFLTNRFLSEQLFDYRNKNGYKYDGDMINEISTNNDSLTLYMIHLMGQHSAYNNRYPPSFNKYSSGDYKGNLPNSKKEIIAQYDNATLYNDYVLDKIISKFEKKNCLLLYISDHGEELFECGEYFGHGTASRNNNNLQYQIRVPLLIWMSQIFIDKHANIVEKLKNAQNIPLITDDLSHFLLGISGIQSKYYRSSRDFLNKDYNTKRRRIVLKDIDFDEYINSTK